MELVELVEIENVTVVRVDQAQDACVADVRILITAEINYTDLSDAIWDSEDGRYYGGRSLVTEIQDTVAAKIFVELKRDGDDITLTTVQFLTPDLTVSDVFDEEYLYPRISDKGWIGQGSDQDLAELARYTRFSMWKCGSDIIPRANRLPTR